MRQISRRKAFTAAGSMAAGAAAIALLPSARSAAPVPQDAGHVEAERKIAKIMAIVEDKGPNRLRGDAAFEVMWVRLDELDMFIAETPAEGPIGLSVQINRLLDDGSILQPDLVGASETVLKTIQITLGRMMGRLS